MKDEDGITRFIFHPSLEQSLGQAIAIRRAIGALYAEGADYGNFAVALFNLGKKAEAKTYVLKAKVVFEKLGEPSLMKQVEGLIEAIESLKR